DQDVGLTLDGHQVLLEAALDHLLVHRGGLTGPNARTAVRCRKTVEDRLPRALWQARGGQHEPLEQRLLAIVQVILVLHQEIEGRIEHAIVQRGLDAKYVELLVREPPQPRDVVRQLRLRSEEHTSELQSRENLV